MKFNLFTPFMYAKNVRYYQGTKILAYIFNELLPVAIIVFFYGDFDFFRFSILWVLFWSFYEVGYFMNDTYSERKENKSLTRKIGLSYKDVIPPTIFRLCLFSLILSCTNLFINFDVLFITLVTMSVFFIHNVIVERKYRIITLSLLGILRFLYIPWLMGVDYNHILLFVTPVLILKILDYSNKKFNFMIDAREDKKFRILLILSLSITYCLSEPFLIFAYFPILLLCFAGIFHERN
jgi:hypothetical protein